jgi:glyoxylase-like metal-dependent hydrolase (beta-lactamase superfamily II)
VDILRWQIGDATVFRLGELDATAALQGLIPKFDLAGIPRDAWLTPDFVDPHHVSVLIESRGQSALITGDAAHHPCQLAHPDWGSASDFDPDRARVSRSDLVERFADSETLIIGSHFADPVAGYIRRDGAVLRLASAAR